jgi:hypothetical protein
MTIFFPRSDEALAAYRVHQTRCEFELVDPDDRTKVKPCGEPAECFANTKKHGLCRKHAAIAVSVTRKRGFYS